MSDNPITQRFTRFLRDPRRYDPYRPLLAVLVLIVVACIEAALVHSASVSFWARWPAILSSFITALLVIPFLGIRHWSVQVLSGGIFLLAVGSVLVSQELMRLRGCFFSPEELAHALGDGYHIRVALGMAGEWYYVLGIILTVGLIFGGSVVLHRTAPGWRRAAGFALMGCLTAALACWGTIRVVYADDPDLQQFYASRSIFHFQYLSMVYDAGYRIDRDRIPVYRRFLAEELVTRRPDDALAGLAGRYAGRSVVVVMLESHRACNVDAYRGDFPGYVDASPELTAAMARGIGFSRYYAGSQKTSCALWCALAGLPESPRCLPPLNEPKVSAFTPWKAFIDAGYRMEIHQATPFRFENTWAMVEDWFTDLDVSLRGQVEGARQGDAMWGMDDSLVFEQTLGRIRTHAEAGRRYVFFLASMAAHVPYDYRGPKDPDHPHAGGMRYQDAQLGRLLAAVAELPVDRRPVVFITADHGYADGIDQTDVDAMRRLPGALLLPDGAAGGRTYAAPFTHLDLGGLLAGLVGLDWPQATPFDGARRAVYVKRHDLPALVVAPPLAYPVDRPEAPVVLTDEPRGETLSPAFVRRYREMVDSLWVER